MRPPYGAAMRCHQRKVWRAYMICAACDAARLSSSSLCAKRTFDYKRHRAACYGGMPNPGLPFFAFSFRVFRGCGREFRHAAPDAFAVAQPACANVFFISIFCADDVISRRSSISFFSAYFLFSAAVARCHAAERFRGCAMICAR